MHEDTCDCRMHEDLQAVHAHCIHGGYTMTMACTNTCRQFVVVACMKIPILLLCTAVGFDRLKSLEAMLDVM